MVCVEFAAQLEANISLPFLEIENNKHLFTPLAVPALLQQILRDRQRSEGIAMARRDWSRRNARSAAIGRNTELHIKEAAGGAS